MKIYVVAELEVSLDLEIGVAFRSIDEAIEYCGGDNVICNDNVDVFENWEDETGYDVNSGSWDYGVFNRETGKFLYAIQEVRLDEV